MPKPKNRKVTFRYNDSEARGTVTLERERGYGPMLRVSEGGTTWEFGIDLWHLSDEGRRTDDTNCVQIVAYDPRNPEAEPVQHLRVYRDGGVETFDA